MEIYMDDFTTYGETDDEALNNLDKVLKRFQEHNLSLSHEKCFMMMTLRIVIGYFVSSEGIQVDPNKIKIISTLPMAQKQRYVKIFIGNVSYYRIFI
jgi:ABC-type taurine transport system ATPase subunit